MNTLSPEEVVQEILDNTGTGKWLSCTYQVQTPRGVFAVGVKAYGKWVQRIECNGIVDSVPEQRTLKAFRMQIHAVLNSILNSV